METNSETTAPPPATWSPGLGAGARVEADAQVEDADVLRLAETFAATPEAVRQAVKRVGPDFRLLQRELGGRR